MRDGTKTEEEKLFGPDAAFDDHDHEWYDTAVDPGELVNLAHHGPGVREQFDRLLEIEHIELG